MVSRGPFKSEDKMKKNMVVVVLIVLVWVLLTAASPLPPPNQALKGMLRWQNASVCGVSDYVPLTSMDNIYLTGKFKPTNGVLQGCQIVATGFRYDTGSCKYFFVQTFRIACTATNQKATDQ